MKDSGKIIMAVLATLLLFPYGSDARQKGNGIRFLDIFTFGVEWSYINTAVSYRHANYISAYGYRVDRRLWDYRYHANAEVLFHAGCNISPHLNLSLYTGYSGIYIMERTVPLSLRGTFYFGDSPSERRWFTYIDAGAGFPAGHAGTEISGIMKLGTGYRIPLSRRTSLDFNAALRSVFSRAGIPDFMSAGSSIYIPGGNLRRMDDFRMGLMFGIGLKF